MPKKAESKPKKEEEEENYLLLKVNLKNVSSLTFLFGLFIGSVFLRWEAMRLIYRNSVNHINGFEYDFDSECVIKRKRNGDFDYCRDLIDCGTTCAGVTEILEFDGDRINRDTFLERFESGSQPIVVRNISGFKDAFTFETLKEIYPEESPIFDPEECQFFSWDFDEFRSVRRVFEMEESRSEMGTGGDGGGCPHHKLWPDPSL